MSVGTRVPQNHQSIIHSLMEEGMQLWTGNFIYKELY